MQKFTNIILVLFFIINIFSLTLKAQETGLEITPAYVELKLKAGESISKNFLIKNHNEYPVSIELRLGEIVGEEIKADIIEPNTVPTWITLGRSILEIASQSEANVEFTLNVPQTTTDGIYTPVILMKLTSASNDPGAKTSITGLVPFQMNLRVSPKDNYEAELSIENKSVPLVVVNEAVNIETHIKNISNDLSKPMIRLQVINPRGEVVLQEVLNESLDKLMPNNEISKSLEYKFNFYDFSNIGKYRVEVYATDTLSKKNFSKQFEFYVLPLPIIISLLVVSFTLYFGVRTFQRSKQNINKNKKAYYK